jgi:hypothetical protein
MSDGEKKVSIFKSPKEADCLRAVLYRCHNVNWPNYSGFQSRVQERGAYGVRRALAALLCVKTKAARARRTPYAPRRRAAYSFRKVCRITSELIDV